MKRFYHYFAILACMILVPYVFSGCKNDNKETLQGYKKVKTYAPISAPSAEEKMDSTEDKTLTKVTEKKDTLEAQVSKTPLTPPAKEKVVKKSTKRKTVKSKKKTPPRKKKKKVVRRPIIKFKQRSHDFGEITEGDVIKHNFVFTNEGNIPLEILETEATCGCTTPTIPFLEIQPGKSNKISVTFNSLNKEGAQNPVITVRTNEPATHLLKLKGFVKKKPDTTEVKK